MDSKQHVHIVTLANSIIGVSILAMPYCFKQCGIILSILLLIFSSVLCRIACHFLLKSAIKARLRTFEFLAYHVFGSIGKLFVEIGMIGFLLGTCVAFFVVMGDLGPQIIAQMTETKSVETLRTTILIAIGFLCVLPLGLLRNINSLNCVCIATIVFYGVLVLQIFSESAPHLMANDWRKNVDLWRPAGILQCIPIFSVALFCQTQLFEIYQAIPNASLDKMNDLVRIAVNMCTSVYIFVGVFGYIAVSHKANFSGNILMDLHPSALTDTMKIGFVLSLAFSFPLVIFPCRASLFSLLFKQAYSGLHDSSSHYIPEGKFRFLTVVIVAISLVIGIIIPNIELVLGLVGSTIGIMICVIFPATCFICLTHKNTNERILAQLMLIIGITIMVLGTYANLFAIENVGASQISIMNKNTQLITPKISKVLKLMDSIQKEERKGTEKELQIKLPDVGSDIKEARLENINLLSEIVTESYKTNHNINKKSKKELLAVEIDLKSNNKEDFELVRDAKANLEVQQKILEKQNLIVESNKMILDEIKLHNKEDMKHKIIALEKIEKMAKNAIESIINDDHEVKEIGKEIVSKSEINANASLPLSYQLGLQNKTKLNKEQVKNVDAQLEKIQKKHVKVDAEAKGNNSMPITANVHISRKNHADDGILAAIKDGSKDIKNGKILKKKNTEDALLEQVENKSVENKQDQKTKVEVGRDILSVASELGL